MKDIQMDTYLISSKMSSIDMFLFVDFIYHVIIVLWVLCSWSLLSFIFL
jgi:hypothetical protein